jgi:hypothetical protein
MVYSQLSRDPNSLANLDQVPPFVASPVFRAPKPVFFPKIDERSGKLTRCCARAA